MGRDQAGGSGRVWAAPPTRVGERRREGGRVGGRPTTPRRPPGKMPHNGTLIEGAARQVMMIYCLFWPPDPAHPQAQPYITHT